MNEEFIYDLWIGEEVVMQAKNIERLMIEIDWEYEGYEAAIVDNRTNEVVYRQDGD